jgi:hypothetical protein
VEVEGREVFAVAGEGKLVSSSMVRRSVGAGDGGMEEPGVGTGDAPVFRFADSSVD